MVDGNNIKNKAISGVFWKGLERIAAQLVTAIVGIILARILMPEDYSVVSIIAIFFTFCNLFISGGLNTSLIQKKDADEVDFSTVLYANLVMAALMYLIMFFAAPLIANIYKKELLIPTIRVMALTFFINGYKAVISAKITSELRFRAFFFSTLIGTVISAFVGIGMAINNFGPWALVAQQMVNSAVDSIVLTFTSGFKLKLQFSWHRFMRLFDFGGKILISSVINQIYNQTKPLIVGIKYSSVDLAYYNKGKTYPDLIANIGDETLSSSLFPALSKVQDDKDVLLSMIRRFMQLSSFFVFPTMFGFLTIAENFVRIVLTDKWLPIVPYLMIFCVSDMFKPIQTGNLQAIRAIGRSDIFLKLEIIKKSIYFVVILLFVIFTNSPILLAVSGILTSLLASLINTYPNRKLIGYGYLKQLQDLGPNFIIASIMGVIVYLMKWLPLNIYFLTVLQILTGMVIYVGINLITRNSSMFYAINTLKGLLKRTKA